MQSVRRLLHLLQLPCVTQQMCLVLRHELEAAIKRQLGLK
jgi:hypothetical protein